MPITDQQIAAWAKELSAIRTQADLAREDVRSTLAGLRAQLRRWAERETALLGLISGRVGEQLPLAPPEPEEEEPEAPQEDDGMGWLSVAGVPCWHIAKREGVAKKTICGEKLPPLAKAQRTYATLAKIATRYHEEVCLDCAQSETQPAQALAREMTLNKKRSAEAA